METSCGAHRTTLERFSCFSIRKGTDLLKGHVEADDDNRQAIMLRELAEETGITDVVVLEGFVE